MLKKFPQSGYKTQKNSLNIAQHLSIGKENILHHDPKSSKKSKEKNFQRSNKKQRNNDVEFQHKKMSLRPIQSFKISEQFSFQSHQKSIDNEQISIGLEVENKTFGFQKKSGLAEKDLQRLSSQIERSFKIGEISKTSKLKDSLTSSESLNEGCLAQLLATELVHGRIKCQQVRNFIEKVLLKLKEQKKDEMKRGLDRSKQNSDSNSNSSQQGIVYLKENVMRPYLQQQIVLLEANLEKLRARQQQIRTFVECPQQQKNLLRQKYYSLCKQQQEQIKAFRFDSC